MKTRAQLKDLLIRSMTLRRQGRYAEALECLDELAAKSSVPCLLSRAQVLAELGRFEEALLDCNEFLRIVGPIQEVLDIRDSIGDRAMARHARALARDPKDKASLRARERLSLLLQYPQAKAA
jgi:tetratricopeptide (TPR) repeat protein